MILAFKLGSRGGASVGSVPLVFVGGLLGIFGSLEVDVAVGIPVNV
jgi:hypothetical protein